MSSGEVSGDCVLLSEKRGFRFNVSQAHQFAVVVFFVQKMSYRHKITLTRYILVSTSVVQKRLAVIRCVLEAKQEFYNKCFASTIMSLNVTGEITRNNCEAYVKEHGMRFSKHTKLFVFLHTFK